MPALVQTHPHRRLGVPRRDRQPVYGQLGLGPFVSATWTRRSTRFRRCHRPDLPADPARRRAVTFLFAVERMTIGGRRPGATRTAAAAI